MKGEFSKNKAQSSRGHRMETFSTELIVFIKEESLPESLLVTEDLSIEDDLGISGDDAYDFIMTFSKKFQVDLSTFDYSLYFPPELPRFRSVSHKKLLTVGMLNRAINRGKM